MRLGPVSLAVRLRHWLGVGERAWTVLVLAVANQLPRAAAPRAQRAARPATVSSGPPELHLYLDPRDALRPAAVRRALAAAWPTEPTALVVLVRYRRPPVLAARLDAEVRSWAASPELVRCLPPGGAPLFEVLDAALRLPDVPIRVVQVGSGARVQAPAQVDSLPSTAWLIPHRGSARWLAECLARVGSQLRRGRDEAFIGLDESPSEAVAGLRTALAAAHSGWWFGALRRPGVGPFVARQRLADRTCAEWLLFQDSDDAPTPDRAVVLGAALQAGNLDAVGSHELRLDYVDQCVVARRFPLDASAALRVAMGHPAYLPTLLLRCESLAAVGGFSTYLRFGLDTQLLLRASFSWRIGNVDAFLYVRRRWPGSLTTNPATALGSPAREVHRLRWWHDFTRVLAGKLALADSSLAVQRGAEYEGNELEPLD